MKTKIRTVLGVGIFAVFCLLFAYWRGSHCGYAKGRLDEEKSTLPLRLYMYLQMYDLRKQVVPSQTPASGQLVDPVITMCRVASALSFYQKYQDEYDEGRWTQSKRGFMRDIERANAIVEELQSVFSRDISRSNTVDSSVHDTDGSIRATHP